MDQEIQTLSDRLTSKNVCTFTLGEKNELVPINDKSCMGVIFRKEGEPGIKVQGIGNNACVELMNTALTENKK